MLFFFCVMIPWHTDSVKPQEIESRLRERQSPNDVQYPTENWTHISTVRYLCRYCRCALQVLVVVLGGTHKHNSTLFMFYTRKHKCRVEDGLCVECKNSVECWAGIKIFLNVCAFLWSGKNFIRFREFFFLLVALSWIFLIFLCDTKNQKSFRNFIWIERIYLQLFNFFFFWWKFFGAF